MDPLQQEQYPTGFVHQQTPWEKISGFFGRFKITFSVIGVLLLGLGLVAGLYLSQRQQTVQQHASAASDVIGYIDNRTNPQTWCQAIYGWTCDRSDPSKAINVHLYSPSPYVANTTHPVDFALANTSSADEAAIAAFCGATTGNKRSYPHRFVLHIPNSLKNNKPIKVYVYGIGLDGVHNPLLVGSGTSITCAAPSATPTVSPSVSPTSAQKTLGDVNGDGRVDILDYNALIDCYGNKFQTSSCTAGSAADLNSDGVVDGVDYNIFLRALASQ